VWEFKQIKDLYLRIVAPRILMFIEFVHEVRSATRLPEVAGVTFSDSESAPVPKFLNPDPGPAIFQI